ncbi:hypothetical protein [Marinilactibacillus psychrotolerans]|uniref:DUF3021 domain-containing protein n=1 Tax=Marinilactibacillus psychrotolerans TaxID=191770 RepID=A0AAV3WT75_9LACT|nr:hypothetical protein [Marinilactibacillus psychrotolerans]GEL65848.1 hypothetical protein MPS01_00030 [Marinilactibacillus psychrotolerans]GEQ34876.1 hypothetical protein M132T_03840 [Marinilactibacillus psychrotolerans]SDC06687.1 hypothetical protein SAMN04488013_1024 [Marinilactibacillus psychrotolerans]
MIKQFFSNNINTMTFVFSIVILINALFAVFNASELGGAQYTIILIAFLILALGLITHLLTYLNFPSEMLFHVVNFISQFTFIIFMGSLFGMMDLSLKGMLINLFIALGIYTLSAKKRKYEFEQLAIAINERLSE